MDQDYIKIGSIAKSLMGHDRGALYVIIKSLSDDFVLICDGEKRCLSNPKTKRIKHLKPINITDKSLSSNLIKKMETNTINDSDIKKALKAVKKELLKESN